VSEAFAALVWSYLEEPLRLDAGDPVAERHENTVFFEVPDGPLDPAVIVAALDGVAGQVRARFATASAPVTFYAWYDEQAGQLRCSLRSVATDALPFGGRHRVVERPDPVVALIVADEHPGVVPWSELSDDQDGVAAGAAPGPFPVFAVALGRRSVAGADEA
jgi:hypothetical protein